MRYSNLHTHSTFSDGKHTLEENVLSAIEKNMLSLGFSDHSYTGCDISYCTDHASYSEYLKTIQQLKQKYSDRKLCTVFCKPAYPMHCLHSLYHGFFHNRLNIRRTE